MSEKQRRPSSQFKMVRDIPIEDISFHLNAIIAEGYTAWVTYPTPTTETRHERRVFLGKEKGFENVTEIQEGPIRVHLLVWYDRDDDEEDE